MNSNCSDEMVIAAEFTAMVIAWLQGRRYAVKVNSLMSREFLTLSPDDKVDRAIYLFHFERVHHLPVVDDNGCLIGILAQHDLRKIEGEARHRIHETRDGRRLVVSNRKVRTVMRRQPFTISPHESIEKAAALMAQEQIGSLPVVENEALVGIVTSTQLLAAFARIFRFIPEEVLAHGQQAYKQLDVTG
jgi:acetoin utilization protein AcuB